jgi:hypothetical protein
MPGPPKGKYKVPASEMHPNTIAAAKKNVKPTPAYQGPADEQWASFLDRVAEGESAIKIVKDEWGISYNTLWTWLKSNPEHRESLDEAVRAKVSLMADEILDIADTADDVPKAKLRTDVRWKIMQSLDSRFKPKQDINVTTLTDEELKQQLAAEVAAFINGSQTAGDNAQAGDE